MFRIKLLLATIAVLVGGCGPASAQLAGARFGALVPSTNPVSSNPSWSIYANPAQDASITTYAAYVLDTQGNLTAAQRVIAAGSKHFYAWSQWSGLEATVGNYTDTLIDRTVAQSGTLPIWYNVALVDTDGVRHVPASLTTVAWDDPAMIAAFTNLLTHLRTRMPGRFPRLFIGNEADFYFNANPAQIAPFARFLAAVLPRAKALFTNLQAGTTFTLAAASQCATYAPILTAADFVSFTYYYQYGHTPTVDFAAAAACANGKPFVFQEIGFTSNVAVWGSSQALQDATVVAAFTILPTYSNFAGATWFTLSDYSTAVLGNAGYVTPLLEFYAETGLRTTGNVAKTAWGTIVTYLGGTP